MGVSPATTHCGKAARLMSGTGWQKKGMLKRGCPHFSLGGLTTRWVVDFNSWLVSRCSMSPTLTTRCSGKALTAVQTQPCPSPPVHRQMRRPTM